MNAQYPQGREIKIYVYGDNVRKKLVGVIFFFDVAKLLQLDFPWYITKRSTRKSSKEGQ